MSRIFFVAAGVLLGSVVALVLLDYGWLLLTVWYMRIALLVVGVTFMAAGVVEFFKGGDARR